MTAVVGDGMYYLLAERKKRMWDCWARPNGSLTELFCTLHYNSNKVKHNFISFALYKAFAPPPNNLETARVVFQFGRPRSYAA